MFWGILGATTPKVLTQQFFNNNVFILMAKKKFMNWMKTDLIYVVKRNIRKKSLIKKFKLNLLILVRNMNELKKLWNYEKKWKKINMRKKIFWTWKKNWTPLKYHAGGVELRFFSRLKFIIFDIKLLFVVKDIYNLNLIYRF